MNWIEYLEMIQKEWSVVKGAPFLVFKAVLIIVFIVGAVFYIPLVARHKIITNSKDSQLASKDEQIGTLKERMQLKDDKIGTLKENAKKISDRPMMIFNGNGEVIVDAGAREIIDFELKALGKHKYDKLIISAESTLPLNYSPVVQSVDTYIYDIKHKREGKNRFIYELTYKGSSQESPPRFRLEVFK